MKRFFLILLAAVIMLSGCAEGTSGVARDVSGGSGALGASETSGASGGSGGSEGSAVSEPPALLTDSPFEDYEFTGEAETYDQETYTYTKYSGAISEEAAKELWALLCDIERGEDIPRDDEYGVAGVQYTSLTAWNVRTGESYFIHSDLLCESPEVDGGVLVITINGRVVAGLVNKLERLIFKGVAREENVIERIVYEPSDPWKDKPEKLTDMNFEELEFSGTADVYDRETRIMTTYQGDIAGEVCAELWELLGEIEECDPVEFGENGSVGGGGFDGTLWIKNTVTGDEFFICDGIYYSDPMLDGGPRVVAINGRFRDGSGSKYYYPTYDENTVSLFDKLTDVFLEGLMREENVYARVLPSEPVIIEKKDIAMVHSYRNWAWGYQHFGEFIDFAGNVYWFDLSDEEVGSDEEFMKVLEDGHFNGRFGDPTGTVKDIDALWEIAGLADNIAEDAKIVKKHEAYDAGQDTIYAVNSEHELVEIYSEGDFKRINTDMNAVRIMAIREKNDIL